MNKLRTAYKPIEIQDTAPDVTSDGGLLLLKKLNVRHRLTARFAKVIDDKRSSCTHSVEKMLTQRVYGIAMGWEDCNDFGELSKDPLYKLSLEASLASQPTLSRLENGVSSEDVDRMGQVLVDVFIDRHLAKPPKRIVLDIDASDDPTHGQQEFQFFSHFYDCHCFVPLFVFGSADSGPMEILAAVLRPGKGHPGHDAPALVSRIAQQIRKALPGIEILVRADSGFFCPGMFDACESLELKYLLCAQTNSVLERQAAPFMIQARATRDATGEASRLYSSFSYKSSTWKEGRRVIVKAEALPAREQAQSPKAKDNARFVVTNLSDDPETLYLTYCGRGESENKIKEMKLDLSSGRTSCHRFVANEFRLVLHAIAFALMVLVREGLAGHDLAKSTVGQIRLKLLKVGATVQESTRRILIRMPRSHPHVGTLMRLLQV